MLTLHEVDADELVQKLHGMDMSEAGRHHVHTHGGTSHVTPYSTRYASKQDIPKFRIPEDGAPAEAVYQILKDELDLDGKPNLNLARYVITFHSLCQDVVDAGFPVSSAHTWKPMLSN